MALDTTIPLRDVGNAELAQGIAGYRQFQKAKTIANMMRAAPSEDFGIQTVKRYDPFVGAEMEKAKLDRDAKRQELEQQQQTWIEKHKDAMFAAMLARMSPIASMLEELDFGAGEDGKPNDPNLPATVAWVVDASEELGLPIGDKIKGLSREKLGAWAQNFIAGAKGLEGKLAEMKATKTPTSPTALIMAYDTPENRKRVTDTVSQLVDSGKMDKSTASGILAVNENKGAWYGSEALEKFTGGVGAKVAGAAGVAPIEISKAQKIEDIKIAGERKKEEQKAQVVASEKVVSGLESANNVLTAISEIEQNPTVLESLPAGWSNIGGALSKYLPAESAGIYAANLDRIANIMSLESRSKLKGQGQISDFEGRMLAAAATNIKQGTAKQRRTELARIKRLMQNIKYRAENNIVNMGGEWFKIENGEKIKANGEAPISDTEKSAEDLQKELDEINRKLGGE